METLIGILRALLRHQGKLVAVPLLTMLVIFYFTRNLPLQYRTEARLYLNLQESKGLSLVDEDLKQYQVHSYFQNTVELLKSKRTLERVRIKSVELALSDTVNFFHQGNEALRANRQPVEQCLREWKAGRQLNPANSADRLVLAFLQAHRLSDDTMRSGLLAFRVMDSNFMKVEITAEQPEKTRVLAQLFIDALIEENRALAKNKIKGHKEIIEGLVRQAKEDLDSKIKRLEQFKSTNTIINLGEHTKAIVVYLVQLEGQRANLMARMAASTRGRQEVLATVQTGNALSLDLSSHHEILALKNELMQLNQQALRSSFRNQQISDSKTIDGNIAKAKTAIQEKLVELARKTPYDPSQFQMELASKYLAYDLEAETSTDMITIINKEIQRVNDYAKRFAPFESTIGAYEQEISTANHVYLTLLNKLSLTESMEYGSGENVIEVIDPPQQPEKPQPSKRWLLVASGGLATFVLLAACFIILHLLDATISSGEKLQANTTLPIAGVVPKLPLPGNRLWEDAWRTVQTQQWMQIAQLVWSRCRGDENMLLLTSAFGEQGQATVAAQIKKYLQEASLRVVVIWANPACDTPAGESDVDLRESFGEGRLMANRTHILQQVKQQKQACDVVLVLASSMDQTAEIHFWMEQANHMMLAFRANRVFTRLDKRAEELIRKSPVSFLGTVLMEANPDAMEDDLGGLPSKKSAIRKWIKKIVTRNLR